MVDSTSIREMVHKLVSKVGLLSAPTLFALGIINIPEKHCAFANGGDNTVVSVLFSFFSFYEASIPHLLLHCSSLVGIFEKVFCFQIHYKLLAEPQASTRKKKRTVKWPRGKDK